MGDRNQASLNWGLALVVGVLLAAPGLAAEKQKTGPLRTGEEAILAALEEKTSIEFTEEPLSSVVEFFKGQHRIEIQLDVQALEDVSMGSDTPITKSIANITLRSALNLVLRDLDLTWVIADEVLTITTPEETDKYLSTRVYDVSDLTAVQDPGGKRWHDLDPLIAVITAAIGPESWESVGGPGSIQGLEYRGAVVLIVRQTLDLHGQIGKLLAELDKVADLHGDDAIPTREKDPGQFMGGMGWPEDAQAGDAGGIGGAGGAAAATPAAKPQ